MEVYIDDMFVKLLKATSHISNFREAFNVKRKFQMKLNPTKYAFNMAFGKFLGFMVHYRGIKANPSKIRALLDMKPPRKIKEVQSHIGRLTALNRFISRAHTIHILTKFPLKQVFDKPKGSGRIASSSQEQPSRVMLLPTLSPSLPTKLLRCQRCLA